MINLINVKPLILLASDNSNLTVGRKTLTGGENGPVASKTVLGWCVHGPSSQNSVVEHVHFHYGQESADDELTKMVQDSFSSEHFGVASIEKVPRSIEEERAEYILRSTTERTGERFQTGLLWKCDNVSFPDSKGDALRRLKIMERKMDADEKFADFYYGRIQEYVQKGYARKLNRDEIMTKTPKARYIPHFSVYNDNKGKFRLVFDAAYKSGGVSLNDELLKGPDLLNSVAAILLRFRRFKIGYTGDVKEMFHQVLIRPEDQHSQRFLWRGMERRRAPDEYVMQAMIFGAACSPASAIYVMNRNAEDFRQEFPDAVKAIQENTYMDDTMDSADSIEDAKKIIQDLIEVNRRGGFQICNFICSSREVTKSIPPKLRTKNWKNLDSITALPAERILGVW